MSFTDQGPKWCPLAGADVRDSPGWPVLTEPSNPQIGLFGLTRTNADGSPKRHNGIDLVTVTGAPIFATINGRIGACGEQTSPGPVGGGYGLRLYLNSHDGSEQHVFAHLSGFAPGIRMGVAVRGGRLIGFAGRSGNIDRAKETHLHWGIKQAGTWIDPLTWRGGHTPADRMA